MSKKGFTLIELLVVITIIGILAIVGSNFNFNQKTNEEKVDRLVEKINTMIHSNGLLITSGKAVKV